MKSGYVIYLVDPLDNDEIYVGSIVRNEIFVEGDPEQALQFASAREAYEWAGEHGLEHWHVGAR
jgi:hypothetical protein